MSSPANATFWGRRGIGIVPKVLFSRAEHLHANTRRNVESAGAVDREAVGPTTKARLGPPHPFESPEITAVVHCSVGLDIERENELAVRVCDVEHSLVRVEHHTVRPPDIFRDFEDSVGRRQVVHSRLASSRIPAGIGEVDAVLAVDDEIVWAHKRLILECVRQHLAGRRKHAYLRRSSLRRNQPTCRVEAEPVRFVRVLEIE